MGELGSAVCPVMCSCCLYLLAQTRAALTADTRHTAPRDTFRSVAQPGPWGAAKGTARGVPRRGQADGGQGRQGLLLMALKVLKQGSQAPRLPGSGFGSQARVSNARLAGFGSRLPSRASGHSGAIIFSSKILTQGFEMKSPGLPRFPSSCQVPRLFSKVSMVPDQGCWLRLRSKKVEPGTVS